MSMDNTPDWIPVGLERTYGGQPVGHKPLLCEPKGASDYCYHCGRDMCSSGSNHPCSVLEGLRLRLIPEDRVLAFGCCSEAVDIADGCPPLVCKKWCHGPGCPVTLRTNAPDPILDGGP